MEKQYIYIIQMHTKTVPARFVKLMTRYQYSHVGICLEKDCDTIYSFGRRSLRNILNGGFVEEERTGAFFQKFHKTACRIYELEVNTEQYQSVKEQLAYIKEHQDEYKYDFVGAVLRNFWIPISFNKSYVCSQFVAEVLSRAGILEFDKKICMIRPKDFAKQDWKEIYTGKYTLYSGSVLREHEPVNYA